MSYEEELVQRLTEKFPEDVREAQVDRPGRVNASVTRDGLRQIAFFLREEMGFEHLSCLSGVDWVEHLENVYHVVTYQHNVVLQMRVRIPSNDPNVLLGSTFQGLPDLRRILLPKDFRFYPLRKDYQGE